MKSVLWCTLLLFSLLSLSCTAPAPYGAVPSKAQVEWQQLEYYMFVHFGPNTFTNVEWGDGRENPEVFNPSAVDCRQWAATAKAAGMKGIIITAKHHDGFCLWPSNFSTHTVRESAWKEGKGDLLKELSDACREYELKFGVYLSPWDRNHPAYGSPEYNQVFASTLNEVLSSYGEVFEQWFDGANGEGHEGKKQVYDWELFHEAVYRNQPQAVIFSDIGPGCRWMGNEQGIAGETNWSTLNTEGFEPGLGAPSVKILNEGEQGGKLWVPAEADVSIRPGWFYSSSTDDRVKSVEQLMDIYYTSVGRNANLLLNVPPNRQGRIHPNDSVRLMEFRKAREDAFGDNLIAKAVIKASNTRGFLSKYTAASMQDDDYNSYWTTDDNILTSYLEIDLKTVKKFNRLLLQEYIPLGQRVTSVNVKYMDANNRWIHLTQATTVGYKRILRFPAVTAQRLRIELSAPCPVISTIGIYQSPEWLSEPVISRNRAGAVSIVCNTPDPAIYYTLDGSTPDETSIRYSTPFALPDGGTITAVAVTAAQRSEPVTALFDAAPAGWKINTGDAAGVSSAESMIDGDQQTFAELKINETITIDLARNYLLKGFSYMPVADVQAPNIYRYDCYVSTNGDKWTQVKSNDTFSNIANNPAEQSVMFNHPEQARYIKIKPLESVKNSSVCLIAEIGIITR